MTLKGHSREDNHITFYFNMSRNDYNYRPIFELIGVTGPKMLNIKINNNQHRLEIFNCHHSIPTIGFGLSTFSQKLKPEYSGLPECEIKEMREKI